MIARTLGAAALVLLAPAAMACAPASGADRAERDTFDGCIRVEPAGAGTPLAWPYMYLPPGATVLVCPPRAGGETNRRNTHE